MYGNKTLNLFFHSDLRHGWCFSRLPSFIAIHWTAHPILVCSVLFNLIVILLFLLHFALSIINMADLTLSYPLKLMSQHFTDTRDIDEKRRNTVIEKIQQSATRLSRDRRVKLSLFEIVNQDPPASCDESIIKAVEAASQHFNLSYRTMISRAYHDSLFMARYSKFFVSMLSSNIHANICTLILIAEFLQWAWSSFLATKVCTS